LGQPELVQRLHEQVRQLADGVRGARVHA
jgi:hypothetical protein